MFSFKTGSNNYAFLFTCFISQLLSRWWFAKERTKTFCFTVEVSIHREAMVSI